MRNMVTLKEEVVNHIVENCPARTKEALRDSFGISYNTLRKIERGEPIRRSLALRLEESVGRTVSSRTSPGDLADRGWLPTR